MALVGIPIAVVIVWQGGWFLGSAMALVAALSAREFFAMARARGERPLGTAGIVGAVALPLLGTAFPTFDALAPWAFGLTLLLTLCALGGAVWARGVDGAPMNTAAVTVMGAVYPGATLAFALLLRHLPDAGLPMGATEAIHGGFLVAFPITVTWIGDSAAYFGGRRWGRRKLVPRISPGKTVAGGVAGLAASALSAALFAALFLDPARPFGVSILAAALVGLALGAGGQLGDLTESVLKREAGVKDSGEILPGHGGVMDRFDALYFTIPLGYVLLVMVARP